MKLSRFCAKTYSSDTYARFYRDNAKNELLWPQSESRVNGTFSADLQDLFAYLQCLQLAQLC